MDLIKNVTHAQKGHHAIGQSDHRASIIQCVPNFSEGRRPEVVGMFNNCAKIA